MSITTDSTTIDTTGPGGVGDPAVGSSELQSTDALRAEVGAVQSLIERAQVLADVLKRWQTSLADAYESGFAAGGPKTRALDEAIAEVTESGEDGGAFGEALTAIRAGCDQADTLGENAAAMGATGYTRSYAAE